MIIFYYYYCHPTSTMSRVYNYFVRSQFLKTCMYHYIASVFIFDRPSHRTVYRICNRKLVGLNILEIGRQL